MKIKPAFFISPIFEKLPHIKKGATLKQWHAAAWESLWEHLENLSIHERDRVLNILIAPNERQSIVKRALAIHYLQRGMSYRKIDAELYLSSQTISMLKKAAKENNFQSYYQRAERSKQRQPFSRAQGQERPGSFWRQRRTKFGRMWMPS